MLTLLHSSKARPTRQGILRRSSDFIDGKCEFNASFLGVLSLLLNQLRRAKNATQHKNHTKTLGEFI
jgi:hypothetical protein